MFEHDGNDFVRKPFQESEIFEMIRKYLRVRYVFEPEEDLLPKSRTEHLTDAKLTVSLKELPEDLHARLKEAAELSDAALIDQVIKEISSKDEALVDDLLKLAENFAYDKILGLINLAFQPLRFGCSLLPILFSDWIVFKYLENIRFRNTSTN